MTREAAEEVVVRRGGCRVRIKAADLVGAEVARAAWSRVVARDARMHNCYQQQTLVRDLHWLVTVRHCSSAAQVDKGARCKSLAELRYKCGNEQLKCDADSRLHSKMPAKQAQRELK